MSTIGVLYTGRAGTIITTTSPGVDGFLRLDRKNSLYFPVPALGDRLSRRDSRRHLGQSERPLRRQRRQRQFQHCLARLDRPGSDYEDLSAGLPGRLRIRAPRRYPDVSATLFRQIWGKPNGWFNYIRLGAAGELIYDHSGTLTDRGLTAGLLIQGHLETQLNIHGIFSRTFYNGRYFDTAYGTADFRIRPFSGSELGLQGQAGQGIDYASSGRPTSSPSGPYGSFSLLRHFNYGPRPRLRAALRRRRHDLYGQPEPGQARLELQRPVLRPGHRPVSEPRTEPGHVYVSRSTPEPSGYSPSSCSPTSSTRGPSSSWAIRTMRWGASSTAGSGRARRHHPDRPDVLPEDRLRLADLTGGCLSFRPGAARLPGPWTGRRHRRGMPFRTHRNPGRPRRSLRRG